MEKWGVTEFAQIQQDAIEIAPNLMDPHKPPTQERNGCNPFHQAYPGEIGLRVKGLRVLVRLVQVYMRISLNSI